MADSPSDKALPSNVEKVEQAAFESGSPLYDSVTGARLKVVTLKLARIMARQMDEMEADLAKATANHAHDLTASSAVTPSADDEMNEHLKMLTSPFNACIHRTHCLTVARELLYAEREIERLESNAGANGDLTTSSDARSATKPAEHPRHPSASSARQEGQQK